MFPMIQARAEQMKIPDSLLGPRFLAMSLLTALKTLSSSAMHIKDALGQQYTGTPSIAAPPFLHVGPMQLSRSQFLLRVEMLGGEDLLTVLCLVLEGYPTTSLSLGLKGKSKRQETLKSIPNTARHI